MKDTSLNLLNVSYCLISLKDCLQFFLDKAFHSSIMMSSRISLVHLKNCLRSWIFIKLVLWQNLKRTNESKDDITINQWNDSGSRLGDIPLYFVSSKDLTYFAYEYKGRWFFQLNIPYNDSRILLLKKKR